MSATTDVIRARYRRVLAEHPEWGARVALDVARDDLAADVAGIETHLYTDHEYDLVVDGRSYTLTVHHDDRAPDDDLGEVIWRRRGCDGPEPIQWPVVALPAGYDHSGTQGGYFSAGETAYDPGGSWEPYAPRGMARGPAREWMHRELVRFGLMRRNDWPIGLTLSDGDHEAALWGIEIDRDAVETRAYLWSIVEELAGEIALDRDQEQQAALARKGTVPHEVLDPVSSRDIADRFGVTGTAVSNWIARYDDFPAPLFTVGRGRTSVWEWDEVHRWFSQSARALNAGGSDG